MQLYSLWELSPGSQARIKALIAAGPLRRRLMDLGLSDGALIECLGTAPGGDPKAFLVRGTALAMRRKDCREIIIEKTT